MAEGILWRILHIGNGLSHYRFVVVFGTLGEVQGVLGTLVFGGFVFLPFSLGPAGDRRTARAGTR